MSDESRQSTLREHFHRDHTIQELKESGAPILVIGGGITGASIAREAALRGLDVALIEQHDEARAEKSAA